MLAYTYYDPQLPMVLCHWGHFPSGKQVLSDFPVAAGEPGTGQVMTVTKVNIEGDVVT